MFFCVRVVLGSLFDWAYVRHSNVEHRSLGPSKQTFVDYRRCKLVFGS